MPENRPIDRKQYTTNTRKDSNILESSIWKKTDNK